MDPDIINQCLDKNLVFNAGRAIFVPIHSTRSKFLALLEVLVHILDFLSVNYVDLDIINPIPLKKDALIVILGIIVLIQITQILYLVQQVLQAIILDQVLVKLVHKARFSHFKLKKNAGHVQLNTIAQVRLEIQLPAQQVHPPQKVQHNAISVATIQLNVLLQLAILFSVILELTKVPTTLFASIAL